MHESDDQADDRPLSYAAANSGSNLDANALADSPQGDNPDDNGSAHDIAPQPRPCLCPRMVRRTLSQRILSKSPSHDSLCNSSLVHKDDEPLSSPCATDGLAEDNAQEWQEDAVEPERASERVSSVEGSSEKGGADHRAVREGPCKGAMSEDADPAVVRLVVHTAGTDKGAGVGTGVIPPTNNGQNDGSCVLTTLLCRSSRAKRKTQKAIAFAQEAHGCETRWYHVTCVKIGTARAVWICEACTAEGKKPRK
ncbi:hypothetical protein K488DRAFT_74959 [Vararia minispora EC-137]|uniref:Uncharacterized protein n=1 Tax=Vararia minispora EC-137 TaxID=1314806 RepID=A0ACB8Q5Q0_9AGAM|nr:hypothetical protein K488DRAFT_74959 [Vararia minispora EC-137]